MGGPRDPVSDLPAGRQAAPGEATEAISPNTFVYECTTTGTWWATQTICLQNCAGGTCFACGTQCQN